MRKTISIIVLFCIGFVCLQAAETFPNDPRSAKLKKHFMGYMSTSNQLLAAMDKLCYQGALDSDKFIKAWNGYCNQAETALALAIEQAGSVNDIGAAAPRVGTWLSSEKYQWRHMTKASFMKAMYQHARLIEFTYSLEQTTKDLPKKIKVLEDWVMVDLPVYFDLDELGAPELKQVRDAYIKKKPTMQRVADALIQFRDSSQRFIAHYKKQNFSGLATQAKTAFVSLRVDICPNYTQHQNKWAANVGGWVKRFKTALANFEKIATPVMNGSFIKRLPKTMHHLKYEDIKGFWVAIINDTQARLGEKDQYLKLAKECQVYQERISKRITARKQYLAKCEQQRNDLKNKFSEAKKKLDSIDKEKNSDEFEDQQESVYDLERELEKKEIFLIELQEELKSLQEQHKHYKEEEEKALKEYHT